MLSAVELLGWTRAGERQIIRLGRSFMSLRVFLFSVCRAAAVTAATDEPAGVIPISGTVAFYFECRALKAIRAQSDSNRLLPVVETLQEVDHRKTFIVLFGRVDGHQCSLT